MRQPQLRPTDARVRPRAPVHTRVAVIFLVIVAAITVYGTVFLARQFLTTTEPQAMPLVETPTPHR